MVQSNLVHLLMNCTISDLIYEGTCSLDEYFHKISETNIILFPPLHLGLFDNFSYLQISLTNRQWYNIID